MEEIEKDKSVKIVQTEVPFNRDIVLFDISLDSRGADEDKEYVFNKFYRNNIRRGNTVIQLFDKDRPIDVFIGRKGVNKFFDL